MMLKRLWHALFGHPVYAVDEEYLMESCDCHDIRMEPLPVLCDCHDPPVEMRQHVAAPNS